ncbi:MAG: hypothetical protein ABIJ37_00465 [Pseudomonadota bacterium]
MIALITTMILMFLIDTFLVGVSFFALKERFQWPISKRISLLLLIVIFALLENYILPMVLVLDITFTVGNADIARLLDLKADEPFAGLFGLGFFKIIRWTAKALLASWVGERLIRKKPTAAS